MVGKQFNESFGQEEPNYVPPVSWSYFTIDQSVKEDLDKKVVLIAVSNRFPAANIGDGVLVNVKAPRVLQDLFNFMSTGFWCSARAASGFIKRLVTSKTMNVHEVITLYESLRTIIKNLESSVKNKEALDNVWRFSKQLLCIFYLGAKHGWPISWNSSMSLMRYLQLHMVLCILKVFVLKSRISYSVWWTFPFWKIASDLQPKFEERSSVKLTELTCLCPESSLICQTRLPHHWNIW